MSPPWSAERLVAPELARALIDEQFPTLAPADAQPFGSGWDNTAFLVNGAYVFRFPRRQAAVPWLEAETRLLPTIAASLPLPVPVPAFVGRPAEAYPWPFAGYARLPGRPACSVSLNDEQRTALAEPLARFLAALHGLSVAEAPPDHLRRLDLSHRLPWLRQNLDRLVPLGLIADPRPWLALLETAPATYTPRTDALVHGDLYARHLLIGADHALAGVIDWGDIHRGDPAVDLAVAHTFLPPAARERFRRAYGPIADASWRVARLRALWHTAAVLLYGSDVGDADLVREGRRSLEHIAALDRGHSLD